MGMRVASTMAANAPDRAFEGVLRASISVPFNASPLAWPRRRTTHGYTRAQENETDTSGLGEGRQGGMVTGRGVTISPS